ncbi:MAG: N-acetylmuramoyl-L-alanine amidase family protein, partial [Parvularcula sp.]
AISGASSTLSDKDLKPLGVVNGIRIAGGGVTLSLTTEALPVKSFVLKPTPSNRHYRLVVDVVTAPKHDFAAAVEKARAARAAREAEPEQASPTKKNPKPSPKETVPDSGPSAEDLAAALELPKELMTISQADPAPPPSLNPARMMATGGRSAGEKLIIVVDPGHGGRDPGSHGASGLEEKDVTLSAGKILKAELERRGYRVLMTRGDDTYIPLVDRIEFARDHRADLFISIHADSNREPLARGATVYTLSDERSDKMEAATTSAGNFTVFDVEAGEDTAVGTDVGSILFDLANQDTRQESVKLAEAVIASMRGRVPMVRNTHRRKSLQVLLSPDVPAVLVELAFLSNAKDEANLASTAWRRRAMGAVADGIDSYFKAEARIRPLSGYGAAEDVSP